MERFEHFAKEVEQELCALFVADGIEGVTAERQETRKVNISYDALTIKVPGYDVSPSINLNQLYDDRENGRTVSYENLYRELISALRQTATQINVKDLRNYEKVKENLIIEVISRAGNEELLETIPYIELEDMAIVFRYEVPGIIRPQEGSVATVLINNSLLNHIGVTKEQLASDAFTQTQITRPARLSSMDDVLTRLMMDIPVDTKNLLEDASEEDIMGIMYIATNSHSIGGAAVIAYPGFLENVAELLQDDLCVLPSSRAEVIILRASDAPEKENLLDMVKEVNETQVSAAEKLTDSVYFYKRSEKTFKKIL